MKIVHVISSIDPKMGGPQAVVMRLAAAQSALGNEVHVVSQGSPAIMRQVYDMGGSIPGFDGIEWHVLPDPGSVEKIFCLRARQRLTDVLDRASFVHIHGVWEPILVHAANVANGLSIPYCVCPAGMLDRWSMQQKAWKKKLALSLGYRRMLNGARFIHALNEDEVRLMAPLSLRAPASIIPNGIFAEEVAELPSSHLFASRIRLADGRRYVLFLSRLHYKKGLDILAEAFQPVAAAFDDVDLVVAGPDDGARDEFLSLVGRFGIQGRVHMVGSVFGREKLEALAGASCFCLPSRQEGFSVAIIEALACGLPVVITDACHFPEVAAADAGAVVAVDPAVVAEALVQVLSDGKRANAMGRNGRKLILENYTWPKIAELTLLNYASHSSASRPAA